mmetsp:Transcript_21207/g.54303  ORF Transcript_21207/g.54303 Transcript_21207/m.54303 type:complete len:755 (+) Transcript_21207:1279-3543(+)
MAVLIGDLEDDAVGRVGAGEVHVVVEHDLVDRLLVARRVLPGLGELERVVHARAGIVEVQVGQDGRRRRARRVLVEVLRRRRRHLVRVVNIVVKDHVVDRARVVGARDVAPTPVLVLDNGLGVLAGAADLRADVLVLRRHVHVVAEDDLVDVGHHVEARLGRLLVELVLQIVVDVGRREAGGGLKVLLVGGGDGAAQVGRVRQSVALGDAGNLWVAVGVGDGRLPEYDLADALRLRVVAEGSAGCDGAHRSELGLLSGGLGAHLLLNVRVVEGERRLVDTRDLVAVRRLDNRAARARLVFSRRADATGGSPMDPLRHVAEAPLLGSRDVAHLEVGELVRRQAGVALVQRVVELNIALHVHLWLPHEDDLSGRRLMRARELGLARGLDRLLPGRLVWVGHHVAHAFGRALVVLGLAEVEVGRRDARGADESLGVLGDEARDDGRVLASDQVEAVLPDEVLVHLHRLALSLRLLVEHRAALARARALERTLVGDRARVLDAHLVLATDLVVVDDFIGGGVHGHLLAAARVRQPLRRVGRDVVRVAQVEPRTVARCALEVTVVLPRLVNVATAKDELVGLRGIDGGGAGADGCLALGDVERGHLALRQVLGRVARVVGEVARVVNHVAIDVGAHDAVEAVDLRVGQLRGGARGNVPHVEAGVRAVTRARVEHCLVSVVRLRVVEIVPEDELVGLGRAGLELDLRREQLAREALVSLDGGLAGGALVVGLLDKVGVLQRLRPVVDNLLRARAHRVNLT